MRPLRLLLLSALLALPFADHPEVLRSAKEATLARALAQFLTSDAVEDVLERLGYDLPVR